MALPYGEISAKTGTPGHSCTGAFTPGETVTGLHTVKPSDFVAAFDRPGNRYFSGHDSDLDGHRPETSVRKSARATARDVAGNRREQQLIPGQSAPWPSVAFQ